MAPSLITVIRQAWNPHYIDPGGHSHFSSDCLRGSFQLTWTKWLTHPAGSTVTFIICKDQTRRSVTKAHLTSQQMLLQSRLQMWQQSHHLLLRQTDYWSPPYTFRPLERIRSSIKRGIDDIGLLICILLFTFTIRPFTSLLTNQLHVQHEASFLGHGLPFPI